MPNPFENTIKNLKQANRYAKVAPAIFQKICSRLML